MCKQNAKKWDLSHALIKIQKLEDIHGTKKKIEKDKYPMILVLCS